ncbi:MAG: hypothetical protein JWM20_864 [Patescibacteria group bacterium]|nr:hypothetical protein [Patescibacteria group bacterium]
MLAMLVVMTTAAMAQHFHGNGFAVRGGWNVSFGVSRGLGWGTNPGYYNNFGRFGCSSPVVYDYGYNYRYTYNPGIYLTPAYSAPTVIVQQAAPASVVIIQQPVVIQESNPCYYITEYHKIGGQQVYDANGNPESRRVLRCD